MHEFEYCSFCHASTFLKEEFVSEETVGGVKVITWKKEGKCSGCGRLIHVIKTVAIAEEVWNG